MTQTYDAFYTGRYHSEVDVFDGYTRGDERFYGFAFHLSESRSFQGTQSYNIAQFIANRPGTGCDDDDWMPSKHRQRAIHRPNCVRIFSKFGNIATFSPGVWHTVLEKYDVATTISNDDSTFAFRVVIGSQAFRKIRLGEISVDSQSQGCRPNQVRFYGFTRCKPKICVEMGE
ncbi:hypothetical protein LZ32DRAFT_671225 [Colletotrichum eremochloae]|nr:hypothetical protein LZ32DRAFT_671225 [Colletotrichum eremochloae]